MGPRRTLKADLRLRLGTFALAAPSHALAKIIHLSISRRYPICSLRPVPDVPAGPILASEVGGPKCKIWGEIGSDLLAGGAGGARLTGTRLGSGPTWPRAEQEAPEWPARRSDTIPVATLRSDRQTPRHTLAAIRFSVMERVRPTYLRHRPPSLPRGPDRGWPGGVRFRLAASCLPPVLPPRPPAPPPRPAAAPRRRAPRPRAPRPRAPRPHAPPSRASSGRVRLTAPAASPGRLAAARARCPSRRRASPG